MTAVEMGERDREVEYVISWFNSVLQGISVLCVCTHTCRARAYQLQYNAVCGLLHSHDRTILGAITYVPTTKQYTPVLSLVQQSGSGLDYQ